MKFKTYLTESRKASRSDLQEVYNKVKKEPETFLDPFVYETLKEYEDDIGGRNEAIQSFAFVISNLAKKYRVSESDIVNDYLDGEITLEDSDNEDRKRRSFYSRR